MKFNIEDDYDYYIPKSPVSDMNVLLDASKASFKGSSWKKEPQKFVWNVLHNINLLRKEISTRKYKSTKGVEFTLNERGRMRHIQGNTMRDRVVRHALCDSVLMPTLEKYLIHNNGASRKGKGIDFAREEFKKDLHNYYLEHKSNEGYIGFVDLSKFYDNIQHDVVRAMILPKLEAECQWLFSHILDTFEVDMSHLSNDEFAKCMDEIFISLDYYEETKDVKKKGKKMMKKSVNIGDQVSQVIGIFFPTWIDNYVKIVLGKKRYGRYMDDMYIIGETKEEVQSVIRGIEVRAKEIGLFVNPKKTQIHKLSDRFTFLQMRYFMTDTGKVVIRINPSRITKERQKLKAYKRLLDKGKMSFDQIKQCYKSWMGSYASVMSKQQIKNMKKLFYDLFGEDVRWKK